MSQLRYIRHFSASGSVLYTCCLSHVCVYIYISVLVLVAGNVVTECNSFNTQENRPEEFRESLNETSSNSKGTQRL